MTTSVRRVLRHASPIGAAVLFLVSVLLLSGCSIEQVVRVGMNVIQNESAGGSNGVADDSGVSQGDENGDNNPVDGEPGLVALTCPTESTRFVLVPDHSWSFSPAGQTQVMEINGSVSGGGGCDIYVAGDVATGADCAIDFTNTGVIHGDGGDCQINGQGRGILSFEGTCQDGQITLTITEIHDPDTELGGSMNCPGHSGPYATFYPPSLTTVTFMIDPAGSRTNESLNDITGFNYHKTWILMPASAIP